VLHTTEITERKSHVTHARKMFDAVKARCFKAKSVRVRCQNLRAANYEKCFIVDKKYREINQLILSLNLFVEKSLK